MISNDKEIKLKVEDEYMPFGPFLTLSALICIFIPANTVFYLFLSNQCTINF